MRLFWFLPLTYFKRHQCFLPSILQCLPKTSASLFTAKHQWVSYLGLFIRRQWYRHVRHSCDHVLLGPCSVGTIEKKNRKKNLSLLRCGPDNKRTKEKSKTIKIKEKQVRATRKHSCDSVLLGPKKNQKFSKSIPIKVWPRWQ